MHLSVLLTFLVISLFQQSISDISNPDVPDYLAHGKPANEGIRVRVTKKGVEYITRIAGHVADYLVPIIKVTDADHELKGVPGHVYSHNIKQTSFKKADQYDCELLPPNKIKVYARGLAFGSTFDYYLWFFLSVPFYNGVVESTGNGTQDAKGVTMMPVLSFNKTDDGYPQFRIADCTGSFQSLKILLKDYKKKDTSPLGQDQATKDVITGTTCDQISKIMTKNLNKNLRSLAAIVPLALKQSQGESSKFVNSQVRFKSSRQNITASAMQNSLS